MANVIELPTGVAPPNAKDSTGVIQDHNQMTAWFLQGLTDFSKMMYVDPDIKKFTEEQRKDALKEALSRQLQYLEDGGI